MLNEQVDVMDMVAFVVGAASGVKEDMDFSDAMKQQFRRPVYDIMSSFLLLLSLYELH